MSPLLLAVASTPVSDAIRNGTAETFFIGLFCGACLTIGALALGTVFDRYDRHDPNRRR